MISILGKKGQKPLLPRKGTDRLIDSVIRQTDNQRIAAENLQYLTLTESNKSNMTRLTNNAGKP